MKMVAVGILLLVFASMFGGIMTASVLGDENYNDHSKEIGEEYRPDEIPLPFEDCMAREEPRTRFKDV